MKMFKDSMTVELMAPIHADLFMQDRFLLNQCNLKIDLYRNKNEFCLQKYILTDAEQYKIKVKKMSLFMKKVEIADNINLALETMLANTAAKYPIRRCQVSSLFITQNRRSTPINSLFSGPLPRRLVVALVSGSGARGSYLHDPFYFRNFGINEIKITSGSTVVPITPYSLNFNENNYLRSYIQMFEGLGISNDNKGNHISREDFKNYNSIFVFDLSPTGIDGPFWELVRDGSTNLQIEFGSPIPAEGVEAIIYAEFDSLVMIDKNRETFTDYSI